MPDDPDILIAGSSPADGTSPTAAEGGGEGALDFGYTVTTEAFSGPLDLLLFLVRRTEVDVIEIPLDTVIDQFVATVQAWQDMDLEVAGDFIAMAATLLEIKARLVAPPPEAEASALDDDNDLFDPRADLIRQLLAYRRFKEAAQVLGELEIAAAGRCARRYREDIPDDPEDTPDLELGEIDAHQLMRTCEAIFARISGLGPRTVPLDDLPLTVRIAEVQETLRTVKRTTLIDLMARETALPARLGLMLATLECTRQRFLEIRQVEQYGNVDLRWRDDDERAKPPELPPEEPLPTGRRRRKPPLVTYVAPPRPEGEADEAEVREDDDGPQETDEQRFLRELNEQCHVDRLLGVAQDVEKSFLDHWYDLHPELRPPQPPEIAPVAVPEPVLVITPVPETPVVKKPRPARSERTSADNAPTETQTPAPQPSTQTPSAEAPAAVSADAAVSTEAAPSSVGETTLVLPSATTVEISPQALAPATTNEPAPVVVADAVTAVTTPEAITPEVVTPEALIIASILATPAESAPHAEAATLTETTLVEATPTVVAEPVAIPTATESNVSDAETTRTEANTPVITLATDSVPESATSTPVPSESVPTMALDTTVAATAESVVVAESVEPLAPTSLVVDEPTTTAATIAETTTPETTATVVADIASAPLAISAAPESAAEAEPRHATDRAAEEEQDRAELARLLGKNDEEEEEEEEEEEDPEAELRRLLGGDDDDSTTDSRRARHAELDEVNAALLADDTPLRSYVETAEDFTPGRLSANDYLAQVDAPTPARVIPVQTVAAPEPVATPEPISEPALHHDAPDLPETATVVSSESTPQPVVDEIIATPPHVLDEAVATTDAVVDQAVDQVLATSDDAPADIAPAEADAPLTPAEPDLAVATPAPRNDTPPESTRASAVSPDHASEPVAATADLSAEPLAPAELPAESTLSAPSLVVENADIGTTESPAADAASNDDAPSDDTAHDVIPATPLTAQTEPAEPSELAAVQDISIDLSDDDTSAHDDINTTAQDEPLPITAALPTLTPEDFAAPTPSLSAALTVDLEAPSDTHRPATRTPTPPAGTLASTRLLILPGDDSGESGRLPTSTRDSAMLQAAARLRSGESGVLKSVSTRRPAVDLDETPSAGVPLLPDPLATGTPPATAQPDTAPPDTPPPDAPLATDHPTPSETSSETDDDMAARAQLRIWRIATAAAALAAAALWWWTAVPRNVLEVVEAPPAVIDGGTPLVWRFNLDVLASDADAAAMPTPSLTPACPGVWSWRDRRSLVFTPSAPMSAATAFTVRLPEHLHSAAGFRLHGSTDTLMHTPALSVETAEVATLTPEGSVIALTFSHPVDPVRLATALSATQNSNVLTPTILDQTPASRLRVRLAGEGPVTLHLPADFAGTSGPLGLEKPWTHDVILGHRLRVAAVSAAMPGRGPGLIRVAATGGSDLSVLAQAIHLDSAEPVRVVTRDGIVELIGDFPPGSERRVLVDARWPDANSSRPLTSYPAAGTFSVAIPHRQPTLWLGSDTTPGVVRLSGVNTAAHTWEVLDTKNGDAVLRQNTVNSPSASEDATWNTRLDASELLRGLPGGRYRIRVRSTDTDASISVDKLVVPPERALAAWQEWQNAHAVTPGAADNGLRICVVGER